MIIVALILVVLCAVVIVGAVFGDPSAVVRLEFFDVSSVDATSVEIFLIGLATGAVSVLALWLLVAAVRRARQKNAERRAMERRHEELEREKAELEHKLGRDRTTDAGVPPAETDPDRTYGTSATRVDPDPR